MHANKNVVRGSNKNSLGKVLSVKHCYIANYKVQLQLAEIQDGVDSVYQRKA